MRTRNSDDGISIISGDKNRYFFYSSRYFLLLLTTFVYMYKIRSNIGVGMRFSFRPMAVYVAPNLLRNVGVCQTY